MVESNVVPPLTLSQAENTKTQDEVGTVQTVKRYKVGPVGSDSSQLYTAYNSLVECGLTTTRSGKVEDGKDWQKREFLVWNCPELSVNTARRITTIYSGMKPENYSMKKVIQPNGVRRFNIELNAGALDIPSQKWKRVSKALHARIKQHNPLRRRSGVKPAPEIHAPMEEIFSTMKKKNFSEKLITMLLRKKLLK